jgi:thiamine transport system permease protein
MAKLIKTFSPWLIPLTFLGLFYFFPLASIFKLSFTRSNSGLFGPFLELIQSSSIRKVIGFTLGQAALSTLITLMLGLPGAYLLARYNFPGKSLFRAVTAVPFVLPTLVVAAGFNALLGPKGWINIFLMSTFHLDEAPIQIIHSFTAILLAHVFYNTTIVLRMVGDFWSRLDPKLGQAGLSLGANRWQVFSKITLPILSPVTMASALLVFIFNFTSFGVILILGGPQFATLEVEIYYQTISLFNLPLAAALSVVQLGLSLGLTIIYTRLSNGISIPITQFSHLHIQKRLISLKSRIMAAVLLGTILLVLLGPLLALVSQSFFSLENQRDRGGDITSGPTLNFYRELNKNPQKSLFYVKPTTSIGISLGYAAITVILALLIGTPAAWALAHDRDSLLNRILDPLLMLPLGTSAVTLGLGFIVALTHPPLDLRASPILIPIAHTLVAFPFVVRSLTPSLRSIKPGLRKAASVLGASPSQVFLKIDIPIIGRALLVASTFAFSISIGEFGATALISRPEYPTLPVVIYRLLSRPGGMNYGQALALSTILMSITIVGMLAIERFRIAEIGEF